MFIEKYDFPQYILLNKQPQTYVQIFEDELIVRNPTGIALFRIVIAAQYVLQLERLRFGVDDRDGRFVVVDKVQNDTGDGCQYHDNASDESGFLHFGPFLRANEFLDDDIKIRFFASILLRLTKRFACI